MIRVDGSVGEGGGQVLRTALTLSLSTGRPFRAERIRAGRSNPGLRRQHLTAVRAAAGVSDGEARGARLGSRDVSFRPGRLRAGEYHFDTGGAGSANLVLQTVLPALAGLAEPSRVTVDGGTHNPAAPPFEFLDRAWAPLLRRTGAAAELTLERAGFHPSGGGRLTADVEARGEPRRLELTDRGELRDVRARAHVANLPRHVAERELATVQAMLGLRDDRRRVVEHDRPDEPANVLVVEVESRAATEVFTRHGRRGLPAEEVAARASRDARAYLDSDAAVWRHLADQLLAPLALGDGGRFRTCTPTSHTTTNARIVRAFLDVDVRAEQRTDDTWEIAVTRHDAD